MNNQLIINLGFKKNTFSARESQKFTFNLQNTYDKAVWILKWNTPFEGIKSNMFKVSFSRKEAIYLGRVYKRGNPTKNDYLKINPGENLMQEVNLSEIYDITQPDQYHVKFRNNILQISFEDPNVMMKKFVSTEKLPSFKIVSKTSKFRLTEARTPKTIDGIEKASLRETKDKKIEKKEPSFSNCTAQQQNTIKDALTEAQGIANTAKSALINSPSWAHHSAERYRVWFGSYTKSRYSKIKKHFKDIHNALVNKKITFINDTSETAYAYVYPSKPYKIYLGQGFWAAPLSGTDSKGGTILHEMSHFNVVANTDDNAYGQFNCKNLAINNPNKAIKNADSHEYFAENNPNISMNAIPGTAFLTTTNWHQLPGGFSGNFDATVNGSGPFSGKCYFFKGDSYIRYNWSSDRVDNGYPKKIADHWYNLPSGFKDNFDAAVNGKASFSGKCYFFKGDSYIRYDWSSDRVDNGYPKKIADHWHNLPSGFSDNFDAVINGGGPFEGKVYFFKGNKYVRYDWSNDRADSGYPKDIATYWHCLPAGYTSQYDTALEGDGQFKSKGYFFKGNHYIRYIWSKDYADE